MTTLTVVDLHKRFVFRGLRLADHPSVTFRQLVEHEDGSWSEVWHLASAGVDQALPPRHRLIVPTIPRQIPGVPIAAICLESTIPDYFSEADFGEAHVLAAFMVPVSYDWGMVSLYSTRLALALAGVRKSLGLPLSTVAQRASIPETQLRADESGASSLTLEQCVEWSRALGLYAECEVPLVQLIGNITPELIRSLREDPGRFRQMSPEQFERFAAERLDRMGYEVRLTGPTTRKDGGVDIIAVPRQAGAGTFLLAGQVKHHSAEQKTGREAVDRLLSLKNGVFQLGLLVTNTSFTQDARWAASKGDNRFFARLRDLEDIKRWLEDDFRSKEELRELPEYIELAPGVRIKTPRPALPREMTDQATLL